MNPKEYKVFLHSISDSYVSMPDKPEETPESILRALWWLALGENRSTNKSMKGDLCNLSPAETAKLKYHIEEWKAGKPVAYLTGRQCFYGLELIVKSHTLIPRKETEILAGAALELLENLNRDSPLIVDVCTGCGNLALLLATKYPSAVVYGSDLSAESVLLAKENAEFHKIPDRITFIQGDLMQPFHDSTFYNSLDLLTCNPPYISSEKVSKMPDYISSYEPSLAFDGGPFGFSILQKVLREAPQFLKSGGWLVMEIGLGQGAGIVKRLKKNKAFREIEYRTDKNGEIRVIMAKV